MSYYNSKTKKLIALLTLTTPFNNRYIPIDVIDRYVNENKKYIDIHYLMYDKDASKYNINKGKNHSVFTLVYYNV